MSIKRGMLKKNLLLENGGRVSMASAEFIAIAVAAETIALEARIVDEGLGVDGVDFLDIDACIDSQVEFGVVL